MNQLLLPLLLMLVVAIPLVMGTRKQKKAAAAQQELLASLAPGDRVMTTSGLYASVADATADTTIDLEIAPGVVTTWLRQAVREKVEPVVETDEDVTDATDTDEVVEAPVVESKDDERVEEKSGAQIAPPLEHGKK
ncbi:preprotein translocase subunit YajC [Amycolatopsis roodepoortensis]|uniref:Preprotein translocase subunit YajC n=1 Tax=Amycolatopsis roodepoortensis TaxID=700274 RepID=A0ABR9L2T1_9PSEU|nr:preprotein translocase subunit YajC [Amycolatopsis roodepoortensis]MBE1574408.1 preprotein translocase subunit YajC [Amycolatopsis roodepoortensis]